MTLVSDARGIARAALVAVEPSAATARCLCRAGRGFRIGGRRVEPGPGGRLVVVALGKGAGRMAAGAQRVLGRGLTGIAITTRGSPRAPSGIRTLFGDHPIPGPASERAGRRLLSWIDRLGPNDAVLFLISGGGSALAEAPWPPITIGEIARTTRLLLASGMPIESDNTLRRHLSAIKGGRLAARLRSGRFGTIAISDVVGDPPADVASGPTVPDPSSFREAIRVARRFGIARRLPTAVLRHLVAGARQERRRGRRTRPVPSAPYVFAATNRTATRAAATEAGRRGYAVRLLARPVVGETDAAARAFAAKLPRAPRRPTAVIGGGETTVRLNARPGKGGRNQEFVLGGLPAIEDRPALLLSIGTDGIDGPTDAAGAWVDGRTAARARALRVDLARALRRHDVYPALARLGALVRTGPTGTNVTDVHVGLVRPLSRGRGSSRARDAPSSRRRSS